MTEIDSSDPEARAEALRLIGLFFINFGRYTSALEQGIARAVGTRNPTSNRIVWSLTGELTADQLRRQFFAATAIWQEHHTEDEARIRKELNKRCQPLAQKRNHLAHGAWYLYSVTSTETGEQLESFEPILLRSTARQTGPAFETVLNSRSALAAHASEAEEVARLVQSYAAGLFRHASYAPGVTDRLGLRDGRLVHLDLSQWTPPQDAES